MLRAKISECIKGKDQSLMLIELFGDIGKLPVVGGERNGN